MGKPGQKQVSGSARKSALNTAKSRPEKSQEFKDTAHNNRYSDEESTNSQTCCSNCQTVFEVSQELLSASDTRVRCGECLGIFDALANLRDVTQGGDSVALRARSDDIRGMSNEASPRADELNKLASSLSNAQSAALAGLANDTASLDMTYSDFDLFSSDAGLPGIQFFDSTRGIRDFHFDDVADIDDEIFGDTLFAQDATVDARSLLRNQSTNQSSSSITLGGDVVFITDDSQCEPLIFNYRDTEVELQVDTCVNTYVSTQHSAQTPVAEHISDSFDDELELPFEDAIDETVNRSSKDSLHVPASVSSSWFLRGGLFAIVFIIAVGLYGYRERDALLNNGSLRPLLSVACNLLPCQLPDQIDLEAFRAVGRSVVTHPTVANALIIKFGIVNQASFSQPHPVLEIRLTDRTGRLVVINQFSPKEYLRGWQQGDVLDMNKRLDIGLAVEDPGNTAISFELDFHEVK